MREVRVIFAGQSGICKNQAIQAIAEYCRRKHGKLEDLARTEHNAYILPIGFETQMVGGMDQDRKPITAFLDSFNNEMRFALWHNAFNRVQQRINTNTPHNVFLALHLCLYRHSNYFTFTDWSDLRGFHPDMIITLFDDIYDVWARIRSRTQRMPDRTDISLKELFAWRSAEAFFAEEVSRNLFENSSVPHYLAAVKHPPEMFEKLIFQPEVPRIYASYPISHLRKNPDALAEINNIRTRLHKEFTVFDPVTIDERILQEQYEIQTNQGEQIPPESITLQFNDRWPLDPDECCVCEPPGSSLYPVQIPIQELDALSTDRAGVRQWRDIDDNIRWRDFALINQAQGLLAYRPAYGGQHLSIGVTRELNYAMDARIIPCVVFWPTEDGPSGNHPFSPNVIIVQDFKQAITVLKERLSDREVR